MLYEWTRDDSAWLRNLLSQPSGQRLVQAMRALVPRVKSVTKESAWIQAVEKQGAEDMVEKFLGLANIANLSDVESIQAVDLTKEGD